jgi:hypothetical protein
MIEHGLTKIFPYISFGLQRIPEFFHSLCYAKDPEERKSQVKYWTSMIYLQSTVACVVAENRLSIESCAIQSIEKGETP